MARTFLVLGAMLAGLAVALGAFAAHGWRRASVPSGCRRSRRACATRCITHWPC
nr:hypothetical protein [Rhodothermus marinus]